MAELSDDDRETLTAYLDGELDDAATHLLEARLGQEPDLRAELDALRQTWGLLDFLPRAAPSPDFTNRTIDRLALDARTTRTANVLRGSVRRMLRWAVVGILALGIGYGAAAGYRRFLVPPVDPDESLVRDLRLLERLKDYEHVEDLEFLKNLDHADLFGEEGS